MLMVLGGLVSLVGLLFTVLGLLVGSVGEVPAELQDQLGNLSISSLGGLVVVLGLMLAGYGAAGLAGGIGALLRRGWGRGTGMIVGGIGAIFSMSGVFPTRGAEISAVISLALLAAFSYSAWALVSARAWFTPREGEAPPAPVEPPSAPVEPPSVPPESRPG